MDQFERNRKLLQGTDLWGITKHVRNDTCVSNLKICKCGGRPKYIEREVKPQHVIQCTNCPRWVWSESKEVAETAWNDNN